MSEARTVLMIAFHFPPSRGSSGIQRTLKFVRYLPEYGWRPVVMSAARFAYDDSSDDLMGEVAPDVPVYRTWALDSARHLSIRGKYFGFTDRPDRWVSWLPFSALAGRWIIRQHRPRVIWSTHPTPTALLIGGHLARAARLPWVVDLRDAMVDDDYPSPGPKREMYKRIEARCVAEATRVVLTTESARELYLRRYPQLPASRFVVIRNGFDEGNFLKVEGMLAQRPHAPGRIRLLHSGLLQPSERDPRAFLEALGMLRQRGIIDARRHEVILRASGHEDRYRQYARDAGVEDIARFEPPIGHYDALAEMLTADGLLIFQGSNCNHLVPAKLYEYFRAGRPIVALTDAAGESAQLMREHGMPYVFDMQDPVRIAAGLEVFLADLAAGRAVRPDEASRLRYSRRQQTAELGALFDSL